MREQLLRVEREVRRCDHRHRVRARFRGMGGQLDRVRGRLRAAVHRDLQPTRRGRDVELRHALALIEPEEHALAGRAEREQPVEAVAGEEVDVRREGVLVEDRAARRERRHGGGDGTSQHAADCTAP